MSEGGKKTGRALVRVKVAEPCVTLSSHSVSFSIDRVNTEDDLGHGKKERKTSPREVERGGKKNDQFSP